MMLAYLVVILTASSIPSALAVPSTKLNSSFLVCGHKPTAESGKPQCVKLLEDLISEPWVHEPIAFGRTQPEHGTIPFHISTGTCELALRTIEARSTSSETFRLIDYFSVLWQINVKCLVPENLYNMGTAPVGAEGLFFAYLGAKLPPSSHLGRNRTIERKEINGKGVAGTDVAVD